MFIIEILSIVISKQQTNTYCAVLRWWEMIFTTILLLQYYKNLLTILQQILNTYNFFTHIHNRSSDSKWM